LKLRCDGTLSKFAFNFNLRRSIEALAVNIKKRMVSKDVGKGLSLVHCSAQLERFVWDRRCA